MHINSSIVFEPINSGGVINPGGFGFNHLLMFKITVGTIILTQNMTSLIGKESQQRRRNKRKVIF